ncbi:Proline racemase [compost metagenome]
MHESIVGSMFRAKVLEETTVGGRTAVIPEISGSAWITGFHQFVYQDKDPLSQGFFLL